MEIGGLVYWYVRVADWVQRALNTRLAGRLWKFPGEIFRNQSGASPGFQSISFDNPLDDHKKSHFAWLAYQRILFRENGWKTPVTLANSIIVHGIPMAWVESPI